MASTTMRQRTISTALAVTALSISVLPAIASAAAQSANTTINATVGSTISITTATPIAIGLTPTSGGVVTSASDTVTVNTNNATGYNLNVADADATTSLVSGANNFTAHTGTKAAPTALANNTWGFAVASTTTGIGTNGFDTTYATETNNGASTSKWAGMPASGAPVALKSTTTSATNDTTAVWYAAKANSAQPNGVYTDTVTYTATTNP